MTYKETLFFIGKCLTVNHEKHNKEIVEKELKSNSVDWESVVKVSTSHFVFPALYCNLKKANFLSYLPTDLVDYMKHITDLNRERNLQIISQAKEINKLLLANNITPIFLKGTGNLLEGLYDDIAERMVGDIDFIISKNEYPKAIYTLHKSGYKKVHNTDYDFPQFKHYPRLNKENAIGAIEVHKEILTEKYTKEFNYDLIKEDIQIINGVSLLSFNNQLAISTFAKQINDHGFYYKNINLRNAYDVFLLSKKTEAKVVLNQFNKLKTPLNCFLALCSKTFNQPDSIQFNENKDTKRYLESFNKIITSKDYKEKHIKEVDKKINRNHQLKMIYKSIFDKEHRSWFLKAIKDKKWVNRKMIEFGLKKPKPNS